MTIADKLTLLASSKEALRVKLGLPKNLPFSEYYKHSYPFDPLTLFKDGKQGVWYDPSDKSTLFQNVGGALLPVTKDGDPVGLMLDKSQGLEGAITNVAKPFIADSSNDAIEVTNTSDGTKLVIKNLSTMTQLNIFEVGKTYKLSVVYSMSETSDNIPVYNTSAGASNLLFTATKGARNKAEVTLTARDRALYFRAGSGEITIHEVVLKEIKGNHATQSVSASRPVYRTDGILHRIEGDGIDDFFETAKIPSIPRDATGMYLCLAANQSTAITDGAAQAFRIGQYNTSSARTFSTNTAPNLLKHARYFFSVQDKVGYLASYESSSVTPLESHLMTGRWGGAGHKSESRINKNYWAEATQALASCGNPVPQKLVIFKGHEDGVAIGGSLFGMVIISSDLTDSDADAVSSYLANKAGVTL